MCVWTVGKDWEKDLSSNPSSHLQTYIHNTYGLTTQYVVVCSYLSIMETFINYGRWENRMDVRRGSWGPKRDRERQRKSVQKYSASYYFLYEGKTCDELGYSTLLHLPPWFAPWIIKGREAERESLNKSHERKYHAQEDEEHWRWIPPRCNSLHYNRLHSLTLSLVQCAISSYVVLWNDAFLCFLMAEMFPCFLITSEVLRCFGLVSSYAFLRALCSYAFLWMKRSNAFLWTRRSNAFLWTRRSNAFLWVRRSNAF